jgi:hypothetical protein
VSNSLISATGTQTATTVYTEAFQIGTNGGNAGSVIYEGPEIFGGFTSTQTKPVFPVGPGLQLIAPSASPTSGNYTTAQNVTLSDISNGVGIYYATCGTAGCTPATPTTASTFSPFGSTIAVTPPEAITAIATLPGWVSSASATFQYVSPNAGYVSSGSNQSASGTSTAINGLSIPSGDIIVAQVGTASGGGTLTITDSNSDTPQCGTTVTESGSNQGKQRICVLLAGATITTVTCHLTSSNANTCGLLYYTPGTLAGTLDQSTGQDQPNATNWTSGTTSTLAGSSDLIVGGFNCGGNTAVTSTPTDGSTQRINGNTDTAWALQDRTAWGTTGSAVTGTFSPTGSYCTAAVVAIK